LLEYFFMALKGTLNQTLTEQQRLERLAKLCEELQQAVDQAGDHRRLLEQVKQAAQELLTDQETKPTPRKRKRKID
jgi:DNA-binding protein H-NS